MQNPRYEIEEEDRGHVVIRDVGPWDQFQTVTNGVESVFRDLKTIMNGRRLFYYDSTNELCEIIIASDGEFMAFAPTGSVE